MLRTTFLLTINLLIFRIIVVQNAGKSTSSTESSDEPIETEIENSTENEKATQQLQATNELLALEPQGVNIELTDDISVVPAMKPTHIILFGEIGDNTSVVFTQTESTKNSMCDTFDRTKTYDPRRITDGVYSMTVTFREFDTKYYVCLQQYKQWKHQGDDILLTIKTVPEPPPIIFKILLIAFLLLLSALFSGLNIGLITLDTNELQVLATKGNEDQRRYAQTILPVRRRGNFLLCSLLLGNVFINAILAIVMDEIISGFLAVVGTSALIVLIGEIIPQAICARYGLVVGAKTIYLTYLLMIITFPIAYPISIFLDCLFGKEIGHVYDRERLKEYIQITKPYNKLDEDEVNIITGILELSKKTVGDVMTKLDDIYMIPITAKVNSELLSKIRAHGYSRIPVYEKQRNNVVALLYVKDIILFAHEEQISVERIVKMTKHPLIFTKKKERLKVVLDKFKDGKCHMALVKEADDGVIGLITMEDIHEEILKTEIIDETDIVVENKKKEIRKGAQTRDDFGTFLNIGEGRLVDTRYVSPQLFYAIFKFLAIEVTPFTREFISRTVLRRLAEQKIYFEVKGVETTLYSLGTNADFFVIIIEGRANLFTGKERLQFECRSFNYFGSTALDLSKYALKRLESCSLDKIDINKMFSKPTFVADFTLKVQDSCLYMKVTRKVYLAALKATVLEKQFIRDKKDTIKEIDSLFAKAMDANSLGKLWVKTHKLKTASLNSQRQRAAQKSASKSSTVSKASAKAMKK